MGYLEKIQSPADIKGLSFDQLDALAKEIREFIIGVTSTRGGHLASSLGVVELTLAVHYVFNSPVDKILWDVGHQAYAHKIITGRREQFKNIRQLGGISGFLKPHESPHDVFGAGHSSTSISAALGFAMARDIKKENHHVIAIIGDGALTGGLAFEGLNNCGSNKANMIVILNDNEMSIAKNVGALASYLDRLRMEPQFVKMRDDLRRLVRLIPRIGKKILERAEILEEHLTYLVTPGVLFEALGFTYFGPFDGHDINGLVTTLNKVRTLKGPRIIHITTMKGKGYVPAEQDAVKFHGTIPFNIETGESSSVKGVPSMTEVFGNALLELAKEDKKIVAITAAMPDGTGLIPFSQEFPERFFDVGIAEQHAVIFAAGMAMAGMRPVVSIYSTFLQRGFDQLIHDVALQNLPVVFALDRAGIVGEDGATHHGAFDLSYLRQIPNMVVMAPKDENELRSMLKTALKRNGPSAIRYPRGVGAGVEIEKEIREMEIGKAEVIEEGRDIAILAIGAMVYPAMLAAEQLRTYGVKAAVVNMRFVKPLDGELIAHYAKKIKNIITAEENVLAGGFGSAVLEYIHSKEIPDVWVQCLGLPDKFIEHGSLGILREKYNLTAEGIVAIFRKSMEVVGR